MERDPVWNGPRRRSGPLASTIFLLVLMVFHLIFISVGTGKFAEEFLPLPRWEATLIVLAVVGIYVTLGGFFGVILTDVFQTVLIAVGAAFCKIKSVENEMAEFSRAAGADFPKTGIPRLFAVNDLGDAWGTDCRSFREVAGTFEPIGPAQAFDSVLCEIPGGAIRRSADGEIRVHGRWCAVCGEDRYRPDFRRGE